LKVADSLEKQHDQFGCSWRKLPPDRLTEAVEVYEMLDRAAGQPVPFGHLRGLISEELEARRRRYRYERVSFDLLWEEYLAHLKDRRTLKYQRQSAIADGASAGSTPPPCFRRSLRR
jgi:hypothetical protein